MTKQQKQQKEQKTREAIDRYLAEQKADKAQKEIEKLTAPYLGTTEY